jgi:Cu2+-exporting ATPase
VADAIAAQLSLSPDQVVAAVSPQGKVDAIRQLQAEGHTVALMGDGINDAPALAQADVGISLYSATDIAMETADVILMGDQLSGVLDTLTLSHATFNKIRQNLVWAFAYNLVAIPLAAGVLLPTAGFSLSPAAAGGMMAFSSVAVVVNSLLLRRG